MFRLIEENSISQCAEIICPQCSYPLALLMTRCLRCNTYLQTGCEHCGGCSVKNRPVEKQITRFSK